MRRARKTYWHLGAAKRLPSDYEIATSRLLYHVDRGGFAVELPTSGFHARNQLEAELKSDRWESFVDPRATTYTKYVNLQRDAESHVGRLLGTTESPEHDANLVLGWLETLGLTLSALRFLCHGLQMTAAYVGQMAPSGRIAVAALFQCGDEVRRVQRFAYRIAQLARLVPGLADAGRSLWQSDRAWQPLRRGIEKLLVTHDWGEALVALNVCLKPVVDDVFLHKLAARAELSDDHVDAQILRSLFDDCRWHRAWTDSLLALALGDGSANRDAVVRWVDAWSPTVDEFTLAAADLIGIDPTAAMAEVRARLLRVTARADGEAATRG